jgi:acetyl-CoA carboxylase carboxyltransferase component
MNHHRAGWLAQASPVHGNLLLQHAVAGQWVEQGAALAVLESMKLEVTAAATCAGVVRAWAAQPGEQVAEGAPLCWLEPAPRPQNKGPEPAAPPHTVGEAPDAVPMRAALRHLHERLAQLQDDARPAAHESRRAASRMSARDNVAAVLEPGSFTEYGALAVAAQRSRRSLADLQQNTPADGLITGTGRLRGTRSPVAVMAYDYTVLAGTQGVFNHAKADRLLALAQTQRLPVLLWAEGGGGRPGDVDWLGVAGLDCTSFRSFAALSGEVPLIGIASGRCFAGNAALLGCCDLIIGVPGTNLGLGGPAMVEGAGLPAVAADDIGPLPEQEAAGVVDITAANDHEAAELAMQLLRLALPATAAEGPAANTVPVGPNEALRNTLPERRQASYEPRDVLTQVLDPHTWLELRPRFGRSLVTGLARLGGRPVAVVASQPMHLGGALDAPSCDKLAQFMALAQSWRLALISFIDCPGFMVGPDSERNGMVRHAGQLFTAAARLTQPLLAVVLRRGFGLGAMAMAGGHFHAPVALGAWPEAEFGAMGLEGAVRLGFRRELHAVQGAEREALFQTLLSQARDKGSAFNMASHLEIDAVIDPADTRPWLLRALATAASHTNTQR